MRLPTPGRTLSTKWLLTRTSEQRKDLDVRGMSREHIRIEYPLLPAITTLGESLIHLLEVVFATIDMMIELTADMRTHTTADGTTGKTNTTKDMMKNPTTDTMTMRDPMSLENRRIELDLEDGDLLTTSGEERQLAALPRRREEDVMF